MFWPEPLLFAFCFFANCPLFKGSLQVAFCLIASELISFVKKINSKERIISALTCTIALWFILLLSLF